MIAQIMQDYTDDYTDKCMITQIEKKTIEPIKYEKDILTEKIIGYCFNVHNELGPGFPERIYHGAISSVLKDEKIVFDTEKEFDVHFNNKKIGKFRCDLVIENRLVVGA